MMSPAGDRSGRYVTQPAGYRAFIPSAFPPLDLAVDAELLMALGRADRALARLDGAATVLPDVDLFISMYIVQEATKSSQIEGTQASMVDVFEVQADADDRERRDAVREIQNYIEAMNHGLRRLPDLPVSLRLVGEIHRILMSEVRGGDSARTPGEFRRSQNWIGGSSPGNARFVPPPVDEMNRCLDEWEKSVHNREQIPPLLHIGMLHAQFETIHPFLDGNGRVGRLLVTFLLTEQGVLVQPLLYLSIFFKAHQEEYYRRLQATRDVGDWEGWLRFFVDGVAETATGATDTVRSIIRLRDSDRARLSELGRKGASAMRLHDFLFSRPVITAKTVQEFLGITHPTANSLISDFERLGVLHEWTGHRRNRSWIYKGYLDIFLGSADRR